MADNGFKVNLFVILKTRFAFEIFFALVTATPARVLNLYVFLFQREDFGASLAFQTKLLARSQIRNAFTVAFEIDNFMDPHVLLKGFL